ncbi:MAG: pantothenate kinase, partial [Treponema sp.]|nr:pantothenate kinase [Treponema sp.]
MIAGIDVGTTITKAVFIEDGRLTLKVKTRASDAITAATGALGKIVLENGIPMSAIEGIRITGVGAAQIKNDIFGIPTSRV